MPAPVQEDQQGLIVRMTIQQGGTAVDVSDATTKQLIFRGPNETATTVTAAFSSDGSDGKIQYATTTSDSVLDNAGRWEVQGKVADGSTYTRFTSRELVECVGNLS